MIGQNMNLAFNLEQIYDNCSFTLGELDKVGIVGVNGAGKTTLFKIILGEQQLDSGKVLISNKRIGYLPQEVVLEDKNVTVFDYLLSARPIKKLEQELVELYNNVAVADKKEQNKYLKKIDKVQSLLEYYDVYNYENILLSLIDNMKINPNLLDMKLINLSGGQKSKIAFLHLLYSKPDILLLDEPTNHLDKDTRDFITEYLKKYKGMVLIISHDVEFLNKIVNKIMYMDKANKAINVYNGNYSIYLKKKEIEKEVKERLIEKQEKEIKELKSFIDKASKASRTNHNLKRMGKDREKKLEKKLDEVITRDINYGKVKLNIKPNREGSKIPLKINNIFFNYPNNESLYHNLSFEVNNKERILIVGKNGVGKSTLLKLIVGYLKPNDGSIWYGNKTDIAYYAQELELLDLNKNIIENVDSKDYSPKEIRNILSRFLFFGDDVFKKISILSPGEKARIALCKVMLKKANLLLLDEPTNHLDPETQKIIGSNFKEYEGTIIMVSHNESFVESIGIDRVLILPNGKITNYSKEILEKHTEKDKN